MTKRFPCISTMSDKQANACLIGLSDLLASLLDEDDKFIFTIHGAGSGVHTVTSIGGSANEVRHILDIVLDSLDNGRQGHHDPKGIDPSKT